MQFSKENVQVQNQMVKCGIFPFCLNLPLCPLVDTGCGGLLLGLECVGVPALELAMQALVLVVVVQVPELLVQEVQEELELQDVVQLVFGSLPFVGQRGSIFFDDV